ncbi:MAG: AraC family transcriptional regulator [Flavobacteriaceae bacterium]|nr:AraC family transcriptional regulator [Flavobacteriaceae bacterium]
MNLTGTYQKNNLGIFPFLLALVFFLDGFSQNNSGHLNATEIRSLTFKEISDLENQAWNQDNMVQLRKLTQAHEQKAKAENNNIEIARAFYYRALFEEPKIALLYADSIIQVTKNSNHLNYPTLGYILKGHIFYNANNFQDALNNYLEAYNMALAKENTEQQREISLSIAAIRNLNGQHYAAAELYKRSLKLLMRQNNFESIHYEEFIALLFNLSTTHLRLQEIDSAKYYVKNGIDQSLIFKDKLNFRDFVMLDAQINYYDKDYLRAKDTLLKYVDSLEGTNKAIKLYYLGKIEEKLGNGMLSLRYFENIDSILSETLDPFIEIKDVYQQLIFRSLLNEDKPKQIEYMGKLIYYDSILSTGQEDILNKATISYDIPYFRHQKKKTEEQLKAKSRYISYAGILAGFSVLSGLVFFVRTRRMRTRLNLLLEKGPIIQSIAPVKNLRPPSTVPEAIRIDILKSLEEFENSDRFMRADLDLPSLALELETNTAYLSTVINSYKQLSFPNYINDLKITRAINRISDTPELLKFSHQGLAKHFGFKTAGSFSAAFYKKTGVTVSEFLKELNFRKNNTSFINGDM